MSTPKGLAELEQELEKSPEYVEAGRRLRPILDLADDMLALRMRQQLSFDTVAYRSGLNYKRVRRIESCLANPTLDELNAIAWALDARLEVRLVANEEATDD